MRLKQTFIYPSIYLGVTLDQDMTWKTMRGNVVRKINSVLKFLYRKSSFLNFRNRILLCSTLLQSRFDYGHNLYYRGLYKEIIISDSSEQNDKVYFGLQ